LVLNHNFNINWHSNSADGAATDITTTD